jgi:hypothetical protein
MLTALERSIPELGFKAPAEILKLDVANLNAPPLSVKEKFPPIPPKLNDFPTSRHPTQQQTLLWDLNPFSAFEDFP